MAPRGLTVVMSQEEEKDILQAIKDIVLTQHKTVTFTDLCRDHEIHVDRAQALLQQTAQSNSGELVAKYVLSGYKSGEDKEKDMKILKFMEVDQDELEECKKEHFSEVTACYVRSLMPLLEAEDDKVKTENADEEDGYNVLRDDTDIKRAQKASLIFNDSVTIREQNLKFFVVSPKDASPKVVPLDDKKSVKLDIKSIVAKGGATKSITKHNKKETLKSKFKEEKQVKEEKVVEDILSTNSDDSNTRDSIDSESASNRSEKREDDDTKSGSVDEQEEVVVKDTKFSKRSVKKTVEKKPKTEKTAAKKKASKTSLSFSSDEETAEKSDEKSAGESPVKKCAPSKYGKKAKVILSDSEPDEKKPPSKARKRVKAQFSDSESEEEKPDRKSLKKKKKSIHIEESDEEPEEVFKRKPLAALDPKELVEEDELEEDEDGYLVTNRVKKCVAVEVKDEPTIVKEKKAVKSVTKKSSGKKTLINDKDKKAQKSIMSFFKPAVK